MGSEVYAKRMRDATRLSLREQKDAKVQIRKLYERCAEQLARDASAMKEGSLTKRWAEDYQRQMTGRVHELWGEVNKLTKKSARKAAVAAVEVQRNTLAAAASLQGLDMHGTFSSVFSKTPDDALSAVFGGSIYNGNGSMSRRIWHNEAMMNGQLQQVIAEGIAKHQSPVQLAKALEAYVNPEAALPDNWNEIYDIPFPLSVDYNAKRLAVTAINHAAWQATIAAARDNPYADYLHWELSVTHHIKDVCDIYATEDQYGLGIGNHPIDEAPLPHPFCKCTWYVDTDKSLEDIGGELGAWARGGSNAILDAWFAEHDRKTFDIEDSDVNPIGVCDFDKIIHAFPKARTNIVVCTDERIQHFNDRHPGDYEKYADRMALLFRDPTLIVKSTKKPYSAMFMREYDDGLVLKGLVSIARASDPPKYKNSVISFHKTTSRFMVNQMRNPENIVYKKRSLCYTDNATK